MEQYDQPTQSSVEKLAELNDKAREEFGEAALFTYLSRKDNNATTLTLTEALDICGQHIAQVSVDDALSMLRTMQERAVFLQKYDELHPGESRLEQTIERGRETREKALAKQALNAPEG